MVQRLTRSRQDAAVGIRTGTTLHGVATFAGDDACNTQDEKSGTIQEIMLDLQTGRVRHAERSAGALSDTGVASGGIGDNSRGQWMAPVTLVAARLFGSSLHRSQREHGVRSLDIPQAAPAERRSLLSVTPRISGRRELAAARTWLRTRWKGS